ncbi:MAG: hypothetical protein V4485_03655 [Pseudomonadota bacterium]
MTRGGRRYDYNFKAEMTMAASNETKSIVEICVEHNVPKAK